jgi:hypothetical protein
MKPLDPERMEKLVSSMRVALRLLGELCELPVSEFMADPHKQSSAKYNFIGMWTRANCAGSWKQDLAISAAICPR